VIQAKKEVSEEEKSEFEFTSETSEEEDEDEYFEDMFGSDSGDDEDGYIDRSALNAEKNRVEDMSLGEDGYVDKDELDNERLAYNMFLAGTQCSDVDLTINEEVDEEKGYFTELEEWPADNPYRYKSTPQVSLHPLYSEIGFQHSQCLTEDEVKGLGDWNERFQKIVEQLRSFDYTTPLVERFNTARDLIHLAQDFIYSSSSYGKIIISEAFVPIDQKTIKPIEIGGLCGGSKYRVNNIIFKFAVDDKGLYGSDYAAAKVAGAELKGLMAYFNLGLKGICLPVMALLDYRGFRLIAMSILPIKRLIYGSSDFGYTIKKENKLLNRIMREASLRLNIKPHYCGMSKKGVKLSSPADLEGHIGTDNRIYLLDFSRVFPPEYPKPGVKMAHLFRLLRPEFVKNYPRPLCSDAFSGFIRYHSPKEHNKEIKDATEYLTDVLVPAFVPELTRLFTTAKRNGDLESLKLTEIVHRRGINIRYLGILRKHMKDQDGKALLFVEMCARVIKNNLRLRLREQMRKLQLPLEEPYRRLVVDYLNLILGHNDQSEEYWANNIKMSLVRKFEYALSEEEEQQDFPLKCLLDVFSDIRIDGKLLLFNRLQKFCGLKFTHRLNEEFTNNKNCWVSRGEQPLDDTDLEEVGLRVKHMNIVTYAQGYFLHLKANMAWASNPIYAQRFYNMALEKFEEALSRDPQNSEILCYCAEMACRYLEGESRNLANMSFDRNHPKAKEAESYFIRAIQANQKDSVALFQYAQFLDKCGQIEEAEEFYLLSLEINPNSAACLQEYGNFLALRKGSAVEAEEFFKRSSECWRLYSAAEEQKKQNLEEMLKSEFFERANNEIELISTPTLRNRSDEHPQEGLGDRIVRKSIEFITRSKEDKKEEKITLRSNLATSSEVDIDSSNNSNNSDSSSKSLSTSAFNDDIDSDYLVNLLDTETETSTHNNSSTHVTNRSNKPNLSSTNSNDKLHTNNSRSNLSNSNSNKPLLNSSTNDNDNLNTNNSRSNLSNSNSNKPLLNSSTNNNDKLHTNNSRNNWSNSDTTSNIGEEEKSEGVKFADSYFLNLPT